MGGWWTWALVSPDGVARSRMVSVSASVNLPLHHKVQKFSSGTGSSGWSWKRPVKWLCVSVSNWRKLKRWLQAVAWWKGSWSCCSSSPTLVSAFILLFNRSMPLVFTCPFKRLNSSLPTLPWSRHRQVLLDVHEVVTSSRTWRQSWPSQAWLEYQCDRGYHSSVYCSWYHYHPGTVKHTCCYDLYACVQKTGSV